MNFAAFAVLAMSASFAFAMPLNRQVTSDTIEETICVPGWTKAVRPPVSYTNKVKRLRMAERGIDWGEADLYELDHKIPLQLGGHPSSPENLQLQPWDGINNARQKDVLETRLKRKVCAGEMSLREAQSCIYKDWVACEKEVK